MRAIPNVRTFIPGTIAEVAQMVAAMVETPGTCYLRLDKSHGVEVDGVEAFRVGFWRVMRDGSDVCIMAAGGILGEVQLAAEQLASEGISARVVSANQLSALDPEMIEASLGVSRFVFTVEENVVTGGLGGLVAETLADQGHVKAKRIIRLGLRGFTSQVGSQQYLRRICGLDSVSIANRVRSTLLGS